MPLPILRLIFLGCFGTTTSYSRNYHSIFRFYSIRLEDIIRKQLLKQEMDLLSFITSDLKTSLA
ncbi:Uncharacterized protein APZ42_004111 [Daphnia magna]|uniref:Uncharacterized protein n=1 Tax=Daphnia magna TaxID=35525 RepID=A0A0P6B3W5_9CRUS|nr:Uncharacterized protein APZ42_004111 [Daphnia magna]